MFPSGCLASWSSFQAKVKYWELSQDDACQSPVLKHREGDQRRFVKKLTWHVDERSCWKFDHQIHGLDQLPAFGKWRWSYSSDREQGLNIWEVRMCMEVSAEQAGRQAGRRKRFQGLRSGRVGHRFQAYQSLWAARRTFFLFSQKKAFILRCCQEEALVNPLAGPSCSTCWVDL